MNSLPPKIRLRSKTYPGNPLLLHGVSDALFLSRVATFATVVIARGYHSLPTPNPMRK